MSGDPCVLEVARAQLESMNAPTVMVPVVLHDGKAGVFFGSYVGDEEWMEQAHAPENQVDVAIACCKLAYADALARGGAHMPEQDSR